LRNAHHCAQTCSRSVWHPLHRSITSTSAAIQGLWAQTLRAIDAQPAWLSEDSQVIVQIHPVEFEPLQLEHLALVDERKYGSTLLCFYEL
jgi:hypothetical protein